MTRFDGNRAREAFTYRRVIWAPGTASHLHEGADYGNVTRGSIELSAFSDTKASCSFDFEGGEAPDTTDLVRIYYGFEDDDGEQASIVLGTFVVGYAETVYTRDGDGLKASGTADGESVLSVLIARKLGAPYTVAAGTDTVTEAVRLVESLGLETNGPTSPGSTTKTAQTFDADDSILTVVNWLLTNTAPTYQAAYPDAYGRVVLAPYIAPEKRDVRRTFRDDAASIMLPEVKSENDWAETPNVCRAWYEDEDECLKASASNVSGSRASLNARGGREVTMVEKADELEGATQADRIAALEAFARQRLIDNSAEIERATLTHALVPDLAPNDAIAIDYSGTTWQGNITNMAVDLVPSAPTTTTVRRFVTSALTITTEGEAVWTA